jgi:hypothetical protein
LILGKGFGKKLSKPYILGGKTFCQLLLVLMTLLAGNNCSKIKDVYLSGRKVILNYVDLVRLWKDPWDGETSFSEHFLELFNVCKSKTIP